MNIETKQIGMKSAREWAKIIAHASVEDAEIIVQQIQDETLDMASLLVLDHKYQKGSMNYNQGFMAGKILNLKSKTVAAMPNDES